MRVVYVDTGALIGLMWSRDQAHERVSAHYRVLRREKALLVTSDPVIAETVTRLRYDAGIAAASAFTEVVAAATSSDDLSIRESDAGLRARAFALMGRYDGLRLSYADCVGATVAQEVRADAVFGLDTDFRVLGFALEP